MRSLLDVAREAEGIVVRFVGADGHAGHPHVLASSWTPGEPVWQGTIDGQSDRDAGSPDRQRHSARASGL